MSEFSHFNPNKTQSHESELPEGFLNIDATLLEASADTQRSMDDLIQGRDRLNDNFVVASIVAGGCKKYEDPDAVRHVVRGAALTQLLLEDAVPNFAPESGKYIADITDLQPDSHSRRDAFRAMKESLVEARRNVVLSGAWDLSPEETSQNEDAFSQLVNDVLVNAGLDGSFEDAVQGLTGVGLEEPTRERDAKYGAALVALGIGITKG